MVNHLDLFVMVHHGEGHYDLGKEHVIAMKAIWIFGSMWGLNELSYVLSHVKQYIVRMSFSVTKSSRQEDQHM